MVAVKADGFQLLMFECYRMVVAVSKQKEELLSECLIVDSIKVEYVFRRKDQKEGNGSWIVRLQVGCNDAVDGYGLQVMEVEQQSCFWPAWCCPCSVSVPRLSQEHQVCTPKVTISSVWCALAEGQLQGVDRYGWATAAKAGD